MRFKTRRWSILHTSRDEGNDPTLERCFEHRPINRKNGKTRSEGSEEHGSVPSFTDRPLITAKIIRLIINLLSLQGVDRGSFPTSCLRV